MWHPRKLCSCVRDRDHDPVGLWSEEGLWNLQQGTKFHTHKLLGLRNAEAHSGKAASPPVEPGKGNGATAEPR